MKLLTIRWKSFESAHRRSGEIQSAHNGRGLPSWNLSSHAIFASNLLLLVNNRLLSKNHNLLSERGRADYMSGRSRCIRETLEQFTKRFYERRKHPRAKGEEVII